ncbi:hypothetical protein pkur_cds_564 [Pandoravirus kuranda]|uniref:Uncharacterized protein n=2 Tax=Pandoravirus TaxID=2060084 RepID=A0AA95EEW3_9VIRU|nr:hypothetical protein pneo_cds_599 [Pandoravirus neocaledonia]AVK76206.1 hypothetical protein pneo_cds_599 [Pandoravirus neocaledonia]WBR14738.1 hypothetical protein pkur_cds_564 [Pandoravirus kuranda]
MVRPSHTLRASYGKATPAMLLTKIILLVCAFGLAVASLFAHGTIFEQVRVATSPFEWACLVAFGAMAIFLALLGLERYVRGAIRQDIPPDGPPAPWADRDFGSAKTTQLLPTGVWPLDCRCGRDRKQSILGGAGCQFDHPGEPTERFYLTVVWCHSCESVDFALQHYNSDSDASDEYGDAVAQLTGQRGFGNAQTTTEWGKVVNDEPDEGLPLLTPLQQHPCHKAQGLVAHTLLASVKLSGWSRVCGVPFPSEALFEVLRCKSCGALCGRKVRRARF